jgi:hypothetical protein
MSKRTISALALTVALVALACSDSVAPPKAATIEANSMVDQGAFAGFPGAFAGEDPEVLVRDAGGNPLAGIPVKFTVTGGGGSVANATTISGPQGRATAGNWTLGPVLGRNTLAGSVDGVGSIQFSATSVAIPTGTFQLATIDGASLPFTDIGNNSRVVVGGTFILTSDRKYSSVIHVRTSDGAIVDQDKVSGDFGPRKPAGLSFFYEGWPWADGAVQGDTLVAYFWDFSENIHPYVFVRAAS